MSVTDVTEGDLEAPERTSGPVRHFKRMTATLVARPRLWRLVRYAATSGLSTVLSEVTLVSLIATGAGATTAALLANVAGSVPSYLLSRYWIWPEAPRDRVARQVSIYWVTSLVSTVLSTGVTKLVAVEVPLHGTERDVVLGAAYLATYAALWLVKFVAYHRWLFSPAASRA